MNNPYRDIQASLLRFASEFASDNGIDAMNLDAHASPTTWPENSFVGPSDVVINFGENEITATLAFVVSTKDDLNLYEMDRLVNLLVNKLTLGNKIRVYDAVAGTPRGHLITRGVVRAGAVLNTETQPAKPVFVNLISDLMLLRS